MRQTTKETAVITPTARVTAARLAIREARPRRRTSTLLWAAQILLGALFISLGLAKLKGGQVQEFDLIGAGQWMRYLVGAAELAGGIGLLTPWLAGLAAAGLAADMFGGSRSKPCGQPSAGNGRPTPALLMPSIGGDDDEPHRTRDAGPGLHCGRPGRI